MYWEKNSVSAFLKFKSSQATYPTSNAKSLACDTANVTSTIHALDRHAAAVRQICFSMSLCIIIFVPVCHLLRSGVAAIFGPQSGQTSAHVQSICDAMEVPHVETRWDYRYCYFRCPSTWKKLSKCLLFFRHFEYCSVNVSNERLFSMPYNSEEFILIWLFCEYFQCCLVYVFRIFYESSFLRLVRDDYSVNLYPHPKSLSKVSTNLYA